MPALQESALAALIVSSRACSRLHWMLEPHPSKLLGTPSTPAARGVVSVGWCASLWQRFASIPTPTPRKRSPSFAGLGRGQSQRLWPAKEAFKPWGSFVALESQCFELRVSNHCGFTGGPMSHLMRNPLGSSNRFLQSANVPLCEPGQTIRRLVCFRGELRRTQHKRERQRGSTIP